MMVSIQRSCAEEEWKGRGILCCLCVDAVCVMIYRPGGGKAKTNKQTTIQPLHPISYHSLWLQQRFQLAGARAPACSHIISSLDQSQDLRPSVRDRPTTHPGRLALGTVDEVLLQQRLADLVRFHAQNCLGSGMIM